MESNVLPQCRCCGVIPKYGLYDGIRVNGVFFCRKCNFKIARSMPGSTFYEQFLTNLKKSLFLKQTRERKVSKAFSKGWSTPKYIDESMEKL